MRTLVIGLAVVASLTAVPAGAQVIDDNFNGEGSGSSVLNYGSFANFDVTRGSVDLITQGFAGLNCFGNTGRCVDLGGSTAGSDNGMLTSKASYAFNVGDTVRLSFQLSGNQRGGSDGDGDVFGSGFSFSGDTTLINYGFNYNGSDTIVFPALTTSGISTSSSVASIAGYSLRSVFFTAGSAGSLTFNIYSNDNDDFGPILDEVSLSVTPAAAAPGVPEPATWAMMMLGFGGIGQALRRRSRMSARIRFA